MESFVKRKIEIMETAVRYFAHVQNKLQEVLEHELPNIEKAADFVVESCKKRWKILCVWYWTFTYEYYEYWK